MRIIAFGHRRLTGKDTCCNLLVTHLRLSRKNIRVIKKGFASKLKSISHDLYAWAGLHDEDYYEDSSHLKDEKLPLIGRSPRDIWIDVGNKMRDQDPEVWINVLFKAQNVDLLLIKDLRYINEAETVLKFKGTLIKVENPSQPEYDDVADSNLASFQGWDRVIVNDSSLQDLNKKVIELAKELDL